MAPMSLDPACQRFLRILAVGGARAGGDLAAQREGFRKLLQLLGEPGPAAISTRDTAVATAAGPILLRLYRPPSAVDGAWLPTLVFFHAGGFCAGGIDSHDGICRQLAEASGCQIAAVDYRLAPEHVFPAQIDDGLGVLRAIADDPAAFGADPQRLAVGGDSVGAAVATSVARLWSSAGGPRLRLQLLLCPALDPVGRFSSRADFAKGFYIEDTTIAADFDAWRGPQRPSVPCILDDADLSGMPPALIHVAGCDPFRDEGLAYGEALRRAGVAADVVCHDGMLHLFHAFSRIIPAGPDALRAIGARTGVTLRAD